MIKINKFNFMHCRMLCDKLKHIQKQIKQEEEKIIKLACTTEAKRQQRIKRINEFNSVIDKTTPEGHDEELSVNRLRWQFHQITTNGARQENFHERDLCKLEIEQNRDLHFKDERDKYLEKYAREFNEIYEKEKDK